MAMVCVRFGRARADKARCARRARRVREARADGGRRTFMACLMLAPLAGLAAPLLAVPWLGEPIGWILAGTGLLACVLLLFRLAMIETGGALRDGGDPGAGQARHR